MKKVHEFEIKSKIVLLAYLNYYQYYLNYTIITTDTKNFLKMGGWGKSLQWQPFKFLIKKIESENQICASIYNCKLFVF